MKLKKISDCYQRYGFRETLIVSSLGLLKKLADLEKLEIVATDRESLRDEYLVLPEGYGAGFMDYRSLYATVSSSPELEMDEHFLRESQNKRDLCYVISSRDGIASHGWYSRQPTRIEGAKFFCFDRHYVYMHKGLTQPEHRGMHLHGIGISSALHSKELADVKGMVSFVDRRNTPSLRSVYRIGCRRIGSVVTFSLFGRFYSYSSSGCAAASVSVKMLHQPEPNYRDNAGTDKMRKSEEDRLARRVPARPAVQMATVTVQPGGALQKPQVRIDQDFAQNVNQGVAQKFSDKPDNR